MTYDHRNLCQTVRAHTRGHLHRQWCVIGHAINPYGNGGRTWAHDHRWADGHCLDCHKTVEDILVPLDEKMRVTRALAARGIFGEWHQEQAQNGFPP
jgi:hypothetical protein